MRLFRRHSHVSEGIMHRFGFASIVIICACVFTVGVAMTTPAADRTITNVLPAGGWAEDWVIEDKIKLHTRETLFDHINGEAELYFPYGFEVLATATYHHKNNPSLAIVADVYMMGSLLDAFGIYSNYRKAGAATIMIGVEGFVSSSQLMFYQDRYFVRLQATGTISLEQNTFLACGQAISQNLPHNTGRPPELEILKIPGVMPKSERYIARSLLGYSFFRRGIIADALSGDERMQVLVIPESSPEAARRAFDHYHSFLKASGQDVHPTESADRISLTAIDPLYGGILVEQTGHYLIGIIRMKDPPGAKRILDEIRKRLQGG